MSRGTTSPPRWISRILSSLIPDSYRDAAMGDLEEGYHRRAQAEGPGPANRWYLRQALKALPHAASMRYRAFTDRWADRRGRKRETMMSTFGQDIRYGLRSLRKSPTFTIAATLTLALAIGVNTAIFSLVSTVVFAELPMNDPEDVAVVRAVNPEMGVDQGSLTVSDYLNLVERSRSFDQLTAVTGDQWVLTGTDVPLRVTGYHATANLLDAWRRPPVLGRGFAPGEDQPGASAVAIISYPFWQSQFGGDPGVLGRTLRLDDREHAIIGVMSPEIGFADFGSADLWVPLALDRADADREIRQLFVSGRLAAGVTQAMATEEIAQLGRALAEETPETHAGWGLWSAPTIESLLGEQGRAVFTILILAVTFVMLIACANLANMLLARATGREQDMSLRAALGARRSRLVRQLLTESFVVSLAAGALGVLFAWGILEAMVRISQGTEFLLLLAEIDTRVLGFTFLISIVAPLVFGTFPALRASVAGPAGVLRDTRTTTGGRAGHRARSMLVGFQVSMALSLMITAVLLTRTMANLQSRDVGFDPEGILAVQLDLPESKYPDGEARRIYYQQAKDAVADVPSVSSVAMTSVLPLVSFGTFRGMDIETRPLAPDQARPPVEAATVSNDFFDMAGIPLVQGRMFGLQDDPDAPPVVLVSQEVARANWPSENPLGQRVRLGGEGEPWMEIVGIVGDVGATAENEGRPARMIWRPYAQDPGTATYLIARTTGDAGALAGPVRAAVWSVDPGQPIDQVTTLTDAQYRRNASGIALVTLFGLFALFALAMAGIGIYGVMSYSVSQRRVEIGVRMALGAASGTVRSMVVRQGLKSVIVGILFGLPIAFGIGQLLEATLYQVSARDPLTFTSMPVILGLIALLASYIPAVRATRRDPMKELRAE